MLLNNPSCLFDQWKTKSAPIFHTTIFWPAFSAADIQAFIAGKAPNPTATHPLGAADAAATKQRIQGFLKFIMPLSETTYACKNTYQTFEEERLAILKLILNPGNPVDQADINDRLFGPLKAMHSKSCVSYLKQHITHLKPACDAVARSQTALLDGWQNISADDPTIKNLANSLDEIRAALKPLITKKFSFAEDIIAEHLASGSADAPVLKRILEASLIQILGPNSGWRVALNDTAPNVHISYDHRSIMLPSSRRYNRDHVYALVIHEIGVHLKRSLNGERSLERLAGYGLPGYASAEEAFGVLVQHPHKTQHDPIRSMTPFALLHYLEHTPSATFRQVYEQALAITLCLANPSEADFAAGEYQYRHTAFTRTLRILRLGTSEVIERSTTKYWGGQLLLLKYFQVHPPTETTFDQFLTGKYDCLNDNQLRLITTHTAPTTN